MVNNISLSVDVIIEEPDVLPLHVETANYSVSCSTYTTFVVISWQNEISTWDIFSQYEIPNQIEINSWNYRILLWKLKSYKKGMCFHCRTVHDFFTKEVKFYLWKSEWIVVWDVLCLFLRTYIRFLNFPLTKEFLEITPFQLL